jgi:hypothetical protein
LVENNLTIIRVEFKPTNGDARSWNRVNKVIVEYITLENFWEASREANKCPSSWPPKEQFLRPKNNECRKN